MLQLNKVKTNPIVCGIELDFAGNLVPSAGEEIANFYNSYPSLNEFTQAYFGKKTVSFSEKTSTTLDGLVYNQTLTIQFPSNDVNRAVRLDIFHKVKFIRILLSNDTSIILGRNDYFQNKKPDVKIESDIKMSKVVFDTKSITPAGFLVPDLGAIGFPVDVPIDFFNYN